MLQYLRAFCERRAGAAGDGGGSEGEAGTPIRFVASTEGVKRDGKDLKAADWRLDNYKANPVVLWVHDYLGHIPPIGRAEAAIEETQLVANVTFNQADEFARAVESKYRRGFLNAVSVGWADVQDGKRLFHDLMDISAVPVPVDPQALKQDEARALRSVQQTLAEMISGIEADRRGAIPPHTTGKAAEETAWDGPGEVAKCEAAEAPLRRMHAWVDGEMDADTKRAYKLPHHLAESGNVVWRGVAAAMSRLLQAGTEIPDGDRRGVYNHLARHYQQFDKEAPEFRTAEELAALGDEEWRGLFLEGEVDFWETPTLALPLEGEGKERVGAVLSARNRTDLEQAIELVQGVLERAKKEDDQPPERTQANLEMEQLQALHEIFTRGAGK